MNESFFGRVIGRTAAAYDGLNAIYLPPGLDRTLAHAVVQEANLVRSGTPPFAILVADEPGDGAVPVASRNEAIRYRQGNRLAVVPSTSVDIASFDGSFREAIGPGFPRTITRGYDLDTLARFAIALLVEDVGGDAENIELGQSRHLIKECMSKVAELLSEEREGAASWNRAWYEVVDRAFGALSRIFTGAADSSSSETYEQLTQRYVWAAFGLARPVMETKFKLRNSAMVEALEEHWSSQERIRLRATEEGIAGGSGADALERCEQAGWGGLDDAVARESSPLAGLQSFVSRDDELLRAFSNVTEDVFVGLGAHESPARVLVCDGIDAGSVGAGDAGPPILSSSEDEGDAAVSEWFTISLSPHGVPDANKVASSSIGLQTVGSSASITELEGPTLREGQIEFGLRIRVPAKAPLKLRRVVLEVHLPINDPLAGHLRKQPLSVQVLPPVAAAMIVAPWTSLKKMKLGPLTYLGPESLTVDSEEDEDNLTFRHELTKPDAHHRVILYAPGLNPTAQLLKLQGTSRPGWWVGDLPPLTHAEVAGGGWTWTLDVAVPTQAPQSLLIAALKGISVDPSDPEAEVLRSLRGRIESELGARVDDRDFLDGLGHLMLPVDQAVRLDDLRPEPPFLVPEEVADKWATSSGLHQASSDWMAARDHFVERWSACVARLEPVDSDSVGISASWPSKRSTTPLSGEPSLVDEMLRAFTRMVEVSANEDVLVRFVSAYPFSSSAWTLNVEDPTCTGVLLSPWHPLRLAWLTSVEATLRTASRARDLVGSVEGWRFPLIGPTPKKTQRMISIPIEAGEGDIFAAWSMMVPLPIGDAAPLKTPQRMGGSTTPGSSASGLTASAAEAAMRDFRRVNSHLASITIDLASSTPTQRMQELDRSVLSAMKTWTKGDTGVSGMDVRDSVLRRGDLPRSEVTAMLREGIDVSLSWSRYQPIKGEPVKSNLRLLQDSGVRLALEHTPGQRNGVVGEIPLRRFEVPSVSTGGESRMEAGIAGGTSQAFSSALRAVEERAGLPPAVTIDVKSTQLTDDNADWTISGQSFVDASLLARALGETAQHGEPPRMLWEWRPPFLAPDAGSPLNRRPYGSIIRVGRQLIDSITDLLAIIEPGQPVDARPVLKTLGAQGIGLSSLLTMGGHHAAGALGFYLAIGLMGQIRPQEGWIQVVMPIDASRAFLDVLAPDSKTTETSRQADLLVIRARPQEVCLIPLEIKMYGLDGDSSGAGLPSPGPAFKEPLDQLEATTRLLMRLQAERGHLRSAGDVAGAALWDNALATLIESGLRLSASAGSWTEHGVAVLQSIVGGDYNLTIGRPLINFFQHHSGAVDQYNTYKGGALDPNDASSAYGAFVARPRLALRALGKEIPEGSRNLIKNWAKLVDWAQEHAVADAEVSRNVDSEPVEIDTPDDDVLIVPQREALVEEEVPHLAQDSSEERSLRPRRARFETESVDETAEGESPAPEASLMSPHGERPSGHSDPDPSGIVDPRQSTKGEKSISPAGVPQSGLRDDATLDVGVRLELGYFLDSVGKTPAQYWPSNTETTQLNMGIVGDLGTGKTQLLKSLLLGLRREAEKTQEEPLSGLVFDYKRDFQDDGFVESVGAKVWEPHRMPLNVLELHEPYTSMAAYKRASAFTSMVDRIFSIGPVQRDRLIAVIMKLFEAFGGVAPTLKEVLEEYRVDALADSVTSVLNGFVLSEIFSEDRSQLVTLDEAMRDAILVVDLNSFGADHQLKNALVVLFLDMYYETMKRSQKSGFRKLPTGETLRQLASYLLVDEASNIMAYDFPVLESLLKEGREFGVGTILSSQYLSHFKSKKTNFAETLSTWFVHKVPNVTSGELSSLGIVAPDKGMVERIKSLGVHESLYKSSLSEARFIRETPFWQLIQEQGGSQ